ncbi:DUF3034 family protein [Pseudoalteromonas sp.]|uniref:DUF3034 family protein n=1 Tax=Pseudoalteromonas sp. TaxID=53249 RepID=UPI002634D1BE|nr:DUF3034 family protein [Pseudoalteromonas sp.]
MFEGSAGVFLTRQLAVGIEYREKPNNLRIGEDSWQDLFVTYIPSKTFNITLVWAYAGTVGELHYIKGLYVSIGGNYGDAMFTLYSRPLLHGMCEHRNFTLWTVS